LKLIALISDGIDSPVAVFLALNAGNEVTCIHFKHFPFTHATEKKVISLLEVIAKKLKKKIKLMIVKNMLAKELNNSKIDSKYYCILCKRFFLKCSEKIALNENAEALLMGDSLGQVASQTLDNLNTISKIVSIPIIRPLIGLNKFEIQKIAEEINTFNTSIQESFACPLLPKKPATKSNELKISELEKEINLNKLITDSLKEVIEYEIKF
jgi:tRNA uracil 4-sulfurtransferase